MTNRSFNASSSDDDEVESSGGEEEVSSSEEEAPVTIASSIKPAAETETDSDSTEQHPDPVKNGDGGEESKKAAFQRVWTEDDEITVLQGMLKFRKATGKSPYVDSNGLYDYIKADISFEASKNQFMDKIRSLKRMYLRKEKNGSTKSVTKPHDKKSFALSKLIWGTQGLALESPVKSNVVSKRNPSKRRKGDSVKMMDVELQNTSDWFDDSFLVQSLAGVSFSEGDIKRKWKEVPSEGKMKIKEELKALQAKEIKFVMYKTKFLHDVALMISEASKNSLIRYMDSVGFLLKC